MIDNRTTLIRAAFEAMVPEFGPPARSRIKYRDDRDRALIIELERDRSNTEIHPIFALAHHFQGDDDYEAGYTANPYRGNHLSIPAYIGFSQEIAVLETSFHKGMAYIEVVTFPGADLEAPLHKAALNMLIAAETR